MHRLLFAAICAALLAQMPPARACACCSHVGQRHAGPERMDSGRKQEIQSLRFAGTATVVLGEADVASIVGIAPPAESYSIAASWRDDKLTLAFRDKSGASGTLVFALPRRLMLFEVDPRNGPDRGNGPTLYKEWVLTAPAAGDGVFRPGIEPRQRLTLVLHGAGNSCTSGTDFTHWTLQMRGPRANYSLIGAFVRAE